MKSRLQGMRWLVVSCLLAAATPRAFAGQAWEVEVHGGRARPSFKSIRRIP